MIASQEYIETKAFIAEVVRTNRLKTADVRVEDGAVTVVVPKALETDRINQILVDKRKWINEKLVLHREALPTVSKEFVSGESFSYLGRNYRLKVNRGHFKPVKLISGRLVTTLPNGKKEPHMVRNALVRWYKSLAESKLEQKAQRYAGMMGVSYSGIGIRSFKSRWGSCSSKGKIDFNWRVIMAPNRVVDYVVVHELAHLKYHDHSPKFWKEVERVIPDYVEAKEWLKTNAEQLQF